MNKREFKRTYSAVRSIAANKRQSRFLLPYEYSAAITAITAREKRAESLSNRLKRFKFKRARLAI
jgi:hypothetical protein